MSIILTAHVIIFEKKNYHYIIIEISYVLLLVDIDNFYLNKNKNYVLRK